MIRVGLVRSIAALAALALAGCGDAREPSAPPLHGGHGTTAPPARFEPPAPGSYALPAIQQIEEHRLLDSTGARRALLGLAPGEAAIVSFVYLSCGEACPLATATLHQLDAELAGIPALQARVKLVSVSFDPERDTPERLAALRESLRPKGRWSFLTAANPAEIAPVLRDFGQDAVWLPEAGSEAPARLRHVLKLFLVDADGAVRNIYSTGFLDLRILLNDLRTVVGVDL